MTSIKEYAYAKINLYLDVLSKRDDGFHDIRTVMHSISLCDELTVSVTRAKETRIRLTLDGNRRLPNDERNLAYRAAERFLSATLIDAEVDIRLDKRIPVSAGLAGGSSDAAAVLRAMNKLFGRPLTAKRLLEIAGELGSDVPYCLIGGTALCLSRGEDMARLPDTLSLYAVVAIADELVSTPEAYASLDKIYGDFKLERDNEHLALFAVLESSLHTGVLSGEKLYNIFENAVFPICSGAEALKKRMLTLGATHALMSGSGPSVFGIFESRTSAEVAAAFLRGEGYNAYYTESVRKNNGK